MPYIQVLHIDENVYSLVDRDEYDEDVVYPPYQP